VLENVAKSEDVYQEKITKILANSNDRMEVFNQLVEIGLTNEQAVHIIQNFFEQEFLH